MMPEGCIFSKVRIGDQQGFGCGVVNTAGGEQYEFAVV